MKVNKNKTVDAVSTNEVVVQPAATEAQPVAQVPVERLEDADRAALDAVKAKKELALERAKAAVAQSEAAELAHNNVVLQLAMKYRLVNGDVLTENGEIQRKSGV